MPQGLANIGGFLRPILRPQYLVNVVELSWSFTAFLMVFA